VKTRVTITLDPAMHRSARRLAHIRQTTVSGLIEQLLLGATAVDLPAKSSLVDAMIGSATLREPDPGSDARYDALVAKHITRHARTD
jgi:hypothetical protein